MTRDQLLTPAAIRERTRAVFQLAEQGGTHFALHPEQLPKVAKLVIEVTRENYPTLKIPFHSRWGHFRAGGKNRLTGFHDQLRDADPIEQARAKFDLVIPSVLLDAGAGDQWKFTENDGTTTGRSEGLAIASLALFEAGTLSSDAHHPLRSDAVGLRSLTVSKLETAFQVSIRNPLIGLDGRTQLIQSLGKAIEEDTVHFPRKEGQAPRPGNLVDYLVTKFGKTIHAPDLLKAVLEGLGPIWPGRLTLEGKPLGDVWSYAGLGARGTEESLVPFHKLSQWLTYSLIEPLLEAGLEVPGVENLTGLAEYRNGGLVLDGGLISLRDPALASQSHRPDSDLIIEWRALTLVWLEKLADEVRRQLEMTSAQLPLAKVLEGGTWWAGRRLARERRPETSAPPLSIASDGTVF